MIAKSDIIKAAYEHGFEDVGFTTADPFRDHKQLLLDRREEYEWAEAAGLELLDYLGLISIFLATSNGPHAEFICLNPQNRDAQGQKKVLKVSALLSSVLMLSYIVAFWMIMRMQWFER